MRRIWHYPWKTDQVGTTDRMYESGDQGEEAETEEESDDGSVKPGSPITTLDWHF